MASLASVGIGILLSPWILPTTPKPPDFLTQAELDVILLLKSQEDHQLIATQKFAYQAEIITYILDNNGYISKLDPQTGKPVRITQEPK